MGSQIGPGTLVTLTYRALDAEGEIVGACDPQAPLEFVFGYGEVLVGLERALDGKSDGARVSVTLGPEEAFGRREVSAVLEVDRDDFPEDVAPGDCFEADTEEGELVLLKVLDVQPGCVVIDTNHPLAEQEVRFELDVLAVRPATA